MCWLFGVLLRDLDENRVLHPLWVRADDGAVRLDDDTVFLAVGDNISLLTPRVELNLVDRRYRPRQGLQVLYSTVA